MKSWSETIHLSKPLRDAQLRGEVRGPAVPDETSLKAQLEAGYHRGRVDGEKALNEQLVKQRGETQEMLQGAIASLRQAVPKVVRDTEKHLIALALAVAQKLVADIPISAEMVEAAVRDALERLEGTAEFTVRLNRADLELLEKTKSLLLSESDGRQFRFLPSSEVTRGGCIVETHFGTVDARRETKLELVRRNLAV